MGAYRHCTLVTRFNHCTVIQFVALFLVTISNKQNCVHYENSEGAIRPTREIFAR